MGARPARPARFLRTQQLFVAVIPALVVASSITGFVWAHKSVTVVIDGVEKRISTQADDVAGALADAGVSVSRADLVTPKPAEPLADGETVVVRHAVPVTLDLSGERVEIEVVGETVTDALVTAGIDPSEALGVKPGLEIALARGMVISVPRTVVRVVQTEAELPCTTRTEMDPSRPHGQKRVVTEGVSGRVLRIYRVLVTGGIEGSKTLTDEKVLVSPVARVIAMGTATPQTAARRRAQLVSASRRAMRGEQMVVTATAYAPGSDGVDWRTATGGRAGYGVIAVDPKVIPLGTRIFVPGYGYGVASDTGGAIDGAHVDLCFENRAEAMLWGRRSVTISILSEQ